MKVGPWHFEESRHLLRLRGEERRLELKAVLVLARLAATPGAVVAKEDLLAAAWPDQHVTDEVLTHAIYQLRRALNDDAKRPRYIETIPKGGYRLMAPVEAEPTGPAPRPPGGRLPAWLVAAPAVFLLALLGLSLSHRPIGRPPSPAQVEELVSRGWDALDSGADEGAQKAAILARRAVELDPLNAEGWALSATAATARAAVGGSREALPAYRDALEAAERALTLAPGHPRALRARARARWLGDWDWEGAERDYRQAVAADPGSPGGRVDLAELLLLSGRPEAARRAVDRALELPGDPTRAHLAAGLIASVGGDLEGAARHYREVMARRPGHAGALRQLAKLDPAPPSPDVGERVERLAGKDRVRPGHLALWFVESGDDEAALRWLARAVAERDPTVLFFRFDPRWDALREDPRFRSAMREAGIAS